MECCLTIAGVRALREAETLAALPGWMHDYATPGVSRCQGFQQAGSAPLVCSRAEAKYLRDFRIFIIKEIPFGKAFEPTPANRLRRTCRKFPDSTTQLRTTHERVLMHFQLVTVEHLVERRRAISLRRQQLGVCRVSQASRRSYLGAC